ncbi:hypothetical protein [Frigoriglobus tundricola]|uniref:Carboxypeptidase regulatory-like domain-containing protein n=1 Tax=Frigoriglobus tundricola TaxID=2774151 RepID=A0A6M5YSD7_9BACT|nr:hypothetical protein [Frigoriglobus tundricola]QJW96334.1 hypothetical protein FTUN_3891 [Frigoriglobus tundricola]
MTRTLAALALATVLGATARPAPAADDPKLPDARVFDKLVIDTLRAVHNRGADLYNTSRDFAGAYRMYEGALVTVRPLLAHRPDAQKIIDAGLDAAEKKADIDQKAFVLHETIEGVRKNLKVSISESKPVEKKPVEKKPADTKKADDKSPDPNKPDEPKKAVDPVKKPADPKKPDVAPPPKAVKPKDGKTDAPPADGATVAGTVTFAGRAVADGEVALVSRNLPKPKAFTAAIQADGSYKVAEAVPPGQYSAMVTGTGVPARYNLANTSPLVVEVAAGANALDLELK